MSTAGAGTKNLRGKSGSYAQGMGLQALGRAEPKLDYKDVYISLVKNAALH